MKLLFTISAVIVLRSGAQQEKCVHPAVPAPAEALCQEGTRLSDGAPCSGGFLDHGVWYDGDGCNPLDNEVFCHNAGCCVVYEASGAHCKEDDLPSDTEHGILGVGGGGFHPYPHCGSLDNDRFWGGYDENDERFDTRTDPIQVVENEIDSNSPGYANDTTKDKPKWLNNTNFVPGWYWCQALEKCLHPQLAWTDTGRTINMDQLDKAPTRHAQKCEGDGGNWKDHIFEAPEMELFDGSRPGNTCKAQWDGMDNEDYHAVGFPASHKHCTIYQLPVGNSYSGKSKTQCASGKVDRCNGAVAFYFSIAGFGHNYNFNFCLSKGGDDGQERTNSWNNGLTHDGLRR